MNGNVHLSSRDISARKRYGFVGQVAQNAPRTITGDAFNASGPTPQISTSTISGGSYTSQAFAVTITGTGTSNLGEVASVSGTTQASSSTAALAAADIVDALNGDSTFQTMAYAERSGDDVIVYSNWTGTEFAFSISGTGLTATWSTTASGDGSELAFGVPVFASEFATQVGWIKSLQGLGSPNGFGSRAVVPTSSAYLSTHVQDLVVGGTAEDSKRITIRVTQDGSDPEMFAIDTGTSATTSTIATAIGNALSGSALVTASVSTATVTVTAVEKGRPFEIAVLETDSSTVTYTATTTTEAEDASRMILGVVPYAEVAFSNSTRELGTTASGVDKGAPFVLVEEGNVLVKYTGSAPSRRDAVYVGTVGAEIGLFFTAAGSDRVRLRRAYWTGEATSLSGTAVAELFLGRETLG